MSYTEFGDYCGVGKAFVSQFGHFAKKGNYRPIKSTFTKLVKICKEANVHLRWLITGIEPEQKASFIKAPEKKKDEEEQSESTNGFPLYLTEAICIKFLKSFAGKYRIIQVTEKEL